MTVRIKLTTWCTFVVRFMRDQLAYEKVHAFQAHYQSIDQEVKKYKKDLTGKNPKAKIDEAHVTLLQNQPMRQALGVRTLGSFGSTQDLIHINESLPIALLGYRHYIGNLSLIHI